LSTIEKQAMSFEKALTHFKEGKFEESLVIFNNLIAETPNQPEFHLNRGRVLSRLGRTSEALEDFNLIVQLEPYNTNYISDRAVVLHLLKKNEEALAEFDRAVNLDPGNPYRYSSRAYFKDRIGDLTGAIEDYEKTIELDPEDAVAYNNKGLVEEKIGYQAKSKKSFEKADELVGYKSPESKSKDDGRKDSKSLSAIPDVPQVKRKMTAAHIWRTIKSIFTDSKTQEEFKNFLKNKFRSEKH
jgi:tetratricopeptide (TPR) repeat protein